ncbi:hypothetical protein OEZ86_003928 [Tetradesmus obliquus]|nr:hypothetical protein OEZ86_003928 [Tetradesmus obliquus]
MASSMKAVIFNEHGGTEVLKFTDIDRPTAGEGQVVIKNEYAGVNFIDTYHRSGLYPRSTFPAGLGEEGAGTVVEVGPGVTGLAVGDSVGYVSRSTLGGSFAEFTAVQAGLVTKLPQGVSTQAAAAVLLQGLTALSMVKTTCQVAAGDWVLVHAAAGGTGQLLCQLCSHIGAKVIGTTSTPEKAEVAKRCGCSDVILYSHEDVVQRVMQLTNGKGVKFVYDGVGKSTFDASLKCLDYLGWLICFGNASGKPEPFDVLRLAEKSARLMRPSLFSTLAAEPGLTASLTAELLQLVQQGVVVPEVHKVYPLSAVAQAQQDLTGRKTTGKLLLRPDTLG